MTKRYDGRVEVNSNGKEYSVYAENHNPGGKCHDCENEARWGTKAVEIFDASTMIEISLRSKKGKEVVKALMVIIPNLCDECMENDFNQTMKD